MKAIGQPRAGGSRAMLCKDECSLPCLSAYVTSLEAALH